MENNESTLSPRNMQRGRKSNFPQPDIAIRNCWANCNTDFDNPIEFMFDVVDKRTGATFKNVTASFMQGFVDEIRFGDYFNRASQPTDTDVVEGFFSVDPTVYEELKEAVREELEYWGMTLFAASAREARMIPGFHDFLTAFEVSRYDDDSDQESEEGELD